MIRFCPKTGDLYILLIVKCEQVIGSSEVTQTTIFTPTEEGTDKDPNLSTFCFPQKDISNSSLDPKNAENYFVFYLKGGDNSTPTYGYVYSFIKNNKRTAYCAISQYYDPPKYYDLVYKIVGKNKPEIKTILSNAEPKAEINTDLNEKSTIQKGIFEFCCLFEFSDLGKLITYMLLDCKIIVAGADIGRVSRCTFGLLSSIYPVPWPGAYIPILPDAMIDAIYAPFPYLIGIHSNLIPETESPDIEGHVLVDLDKKQIRYYPEELPLPPKVIKEIEEFKKKILQSQLDHAFLQKRLRKLILNVVSIALCQPAARPEKLYKQWEKMRTNTRLDDFTMMIVQSQLVLQLMRIIEEGPDSDRYKTIFPATQTIMQRSDSSSFITRAKNTISKRVSMRNICNPKNSNAQLPKAKSGSIPPLIKNDNDEPPVKEEPKEPQIPPPRMPASSSLPPPSPLMNFPRQNVTNHQKAETSTDLFNQILEVASQFEKRKVTIDEMLRQKKEEQMRLKMQSEVANPEQLELSSKIEFYNSGSFGDEKTGSFQKRRLPPTGNRDARQRPSSMVTVPLKH